MPSTLQSRGRIAALALGVALQALPAAGASPDYEGSFATAAALEAEGDFAGAASVLEALIPSFPQDYRVRLQLGWLHFEAKDYPAAREAYQQALELSGGALAPRLGLAWTALRQRDREPAIAGFQAVLLQDPANASATEGLGLAREVRGLRGTPFVAATLHTGSPGATGSAGPWSLGFTLGLPLLIADRFTLQANYRHISGVGPPAAGFGPRSGSSASSGGQNELFGAIGVSTPSFEATLHGAYLFAQPEAPSPVSVGGLRLRASPAGDFVAEASLSDYTDESIWRFAFHWRAPALGAFRLQPGLSLQRTSTELLPAASLVVLYQHKTLELWLGGKFGDEERPTYLEQPSIFNLEQRIRGGIWAGLRQELDSKWIMGVELEVHSLRGDGLTTSDGLLTLISFVLARSL